MDIEYLPVIMIREDADNYPIHRLPQGYSFHHYESGDEKDWALIQYRLSQFPQYEDALAYFRQEFMSAPVEASKRCVFIRHIETGLVGFAALWHGNHLGRNLERPHWIAVSEEHQGKGLAKALMTKLFEIYHQLGGSGPVYLTTQTTSFKAVDIYLKFGFKPYFGPKPVGYTCSDTEYMLNNIRAWDIINAQIHSKS